MSTRHGYGALSSDSAIVLIAIRGFEDKLAPWSIQTLIDVEARDVDDDPWLTVAEIAEELRVNPATVRLWISKGRLPAKRAGQRKLLIRRSDLDRMLERRQG